MKKGSLVCVGTGLHLGQATLEAQRAIEEADEVHVFCNFGEEQFVSEADHGFDELSLDGVTFGYCCRRLRFDELEFEFLDARGQFHLHLIEHALGFGACFGVATNGFEFRHFCIGIARDASFEC